MNPATRIAPLVGVARYEYLMLARRWALWVLPALLVGLTAATGSFTFTAGHDPAGTARIVGSQALSMNLLSLVVVGTLIADRWVRDRGMGVAELLDTQPTGPAIRLWGKYLGVVAAAATPLLIVWTVLATRIGLRTHEWSVAGFAPGAFAAIVVPGLLFVAAFALAGPRLLGLRLFQVLFIGYWFWGNLIPAHLMPTLAGTWLTPVGKYANAGLFARSPHALLLSGGASVPGAYASIALLVMMGLLVVTGCAITEHRRLT